MNFVTDREGELWSALRMLEEERVWTLFRAQHGVATVRQLLLMGATRHLIAGWVRRGLLRRPAHGVLAIAGSPATREQALCLGVLLAGNRSGGPEITGAICGPTAGFLWGLLERDDPTIHVLSTRRVSTREGYQFHWTTRLPERDVADLDGIKVTDPIRTFLDLCDLFPYRAVYIYKRGLRKRLFTPEEVIARIEEESRQGRGGLTVAREVVEKTDPTAAGAKSGGEDRYFDLLVSLGYPPPQRNFKVRGALGVLWEIDLHYPQVSKGFDYSPYDTHMNPTAHTQDGRKDLDLRAAGIELMTIPDGISDNEFEGYVREILGPPERFPRGERPLCDAYSDEESDGVRG